MTSSNKNMNADCLSFQKDEENRRRRSANYKPNIWKHGFLHSLPTKYDKEESAMQLVRLLIEVKGIFVEKSEVLQKLELVDWIQKLGVANYFEKEVNEFLETTTFKNPSAQESLHVPALSFRLLRQHGYKVSPDVLLRKFFNENGTMLSKISCGDDVKDIMELFEASHLRFEEENILEEAKSVVINSLKDTFNVPSSININYEHSERVFHALELPSHWRVPWFDVKWHVKQYHKEKHMEHHLLQLAKLNFNLIQLQLRKEVKELSRWWENLGIEKELSFARNRLVESFMCSAGVAVQPKYKSLRKWLTKLITFILVIDDVYDIHASFEEVKLFTAAFERWDAKEIEELPECMRICFNSLKEVTDETAYEIAGEKNFNMVLSYIKKAWIEFCKALFEEAKWYSMEYIPSLKEYLSNAWISSSGSVILLHIYFATMHEEVTYHEIDQFLHKYEDLMYNISLIIRLCNDLGTTVAERERGDAASSILCYMNEMEVSEDKARKHIEEMINNAWKKINWYGTNGVGSMEPFITQARNAARMAHTLYQNGDGFGIQDLDIKEHISSLLVEPL
ncbi:PREDICTED: alpha-farnesene synthase-like [Lupinus angustifolius]|uniref:alpha-farnesene synthase-like n=1 Tax=Lupinus angustifolius TaxID=3871 RepID=UPI00092E3415|nr:PREDICTED: alpha-farnesene synthase-like [Lupinus angustifolius]